MSAASIVALVGMVSALPADARTLIGTKGADTLRGGKRADLIKGGAGADRLNGGRGNDRLNGGRGNDRLSGGPGRDLLDCGPGRDSANADSKDVVRGNCETVRGRDEGPTGGGGTPGGGGGVPGGGGSPGGDQTPPPPLTGTYTGTLTTTVRYLSVCTGQPLGDQTTQIPSKITIGPPLRPNPNDLQAPGQENNPINLVLGQTNVAGSTAPGSISLASAARFRFTPINSLILPYWTLTLNGTALTGTLTEDNREQAAAFNLLAAHQELVACNPNFGTYVNQLDIAEGATLTGTVTPQQVQLRIAGRTFAGFHHFVAEITATRS